MVALDLHGGAPLFSQCIVVRCVPSTGKSDADGGLLTSSVSLFHEDVIIISIRTWDFPILLFFSPLYVFTGVKICEVYPALESWMEWLFKC